MTPAPAASPDPVEDRNDAGQTEDEFRAAIGPDLAARLDDVDEFDVAWINCLDRDLIEWWVALVEGES